MFALQGGGSLTINSDGSAVFQQSEANTNLSPTLRGTPAFHTGFPGGTFLYQQNGTDVPIFVLERMGATVGLSVSDFGAWTSRSPDGPLGVLGRFYAGGHDPTVPLPSGAVFTYNGSYIGVMSGGNISGGIHLQADFGNLSISSQFTSGALSGWPNGGVGTGKINGDGSYGTSFATNNFGGAPGPVPSYKLSGQFYGQNAAETTGTFSGLAGSSGAAFNGAFGAKR